MSSDEVDFDSYLEDLSSFAKQLSQTGYLPQESTLVETTQPFDFKIIQGIIFYHS